jgi:hypothetical protein
MLFAFMQRIDVRSAWLFVPGDEQSSTIKL